MVVKAKNIMELEACPSCQHKVSAKAFICPICAHVINKPKRTIAGRIIKWVFIAFNILMMTITYRVISTVGDTIQEVSNSAAEQLGAQVGAGIGVSMVLAFWFFGFSLLGGFTLLTRPK
ncbi:conserved hypothetical protein [Vibrio chagasii]|nr:conserved hypothetical protein [Vibrio chagasii]